MANINMTTAAGGGTALTNSFAVVANGSSTTVVGTNQQTTRQKKTLSSSSSSPSLKKKKKSYSLLSRTLSLLAGLLVIMNLFGLTEIETFLSWITSTSTTWSRARSLGGTASTTTTNNNNKMMNLLLEQEDVHEISSSSWLDCPVNASHYLDWAKSIPKYNLNGFCSILPADISPTVLWKEHLEWILDATLHSLPPKVLQVLMETTTETSSSQGGGAGDSTSSYVDTTVDWMSELLLDWFTPQHLRKGFLGRPQHDAWGHVLQLLYQRKQDQQQQASTTTTRPLRIVILGGTVAEGVGSCFAPPNIQAALQDSSSILLDKYKFCAWSHRLEHFLNHILGGTSTFPMVQVVRWTIPDTTTEFATSIVEHGLWPKQRHNNNRTNDHEEEDDEYDDGPDVIINAYSSHDMYWPDRSTWVDMEDFNYTNHRREVTEAFLRAALHSRPCSQQPPLVIALDDYVGHHHPTVMAEMTNSRVLQQMADWYQIPFISYANVVRRWVYSNTSEQVFSPNWQKQQPQEENEEQVVQVDSHGMFGGSNLGSTISRFAVVDTDMDQEQDQLTNNVHYGLVAHVGVLWTMTFAMLSMTVEYCSHETMKLDSYPFVTKELLDMVANVPPPELNADLCLSNVSEKWQEEQAKLQHRKRLLCPNSSNTMNETDGNELDHHRRKDLPHCTMAFWPKYHPGHETLESYLHPWLVEYEAPTNSTGGMGGGAGWYMTLPNRGLVATGRGATLRLQVPIVDSRSALYRLRLFILRHVQWTDCELKWTVRVWNTEQLQQQNETTNMEWNETTILSGSHTADVTQLAYPIDMELPWVVTKGYKVDMTFELVNGTEFEIKSIMLCNNPPHRLQL